MFSDGSAIIFFDSPLGFKSRVSNRKMKTFYPIVFSKFYQFFIICFNETLKRCSRHISSGDHFHLLYFINEDESYIKISTFLPFTSRGETRFFSAIPWKDNLLSLEINRFSKATNCWENDVFSVTSKDYNLYGRPLRIYFPKPYAHVEKKYRGSFDYFKGLQYLMQYKMLKGLERHLNYSLKITDKNGRPEFEIRGDLASYTNCLTIAGSMTRPYWFRSLHLAVPVGEEYSDFEKLLLPFELPVWIWIVSTFVTAYATIFLLRFAKSSIRNVIIGKTISTPSLNIAMIFSGTSQVKMPIKSFARFLVMSFIIFSMIFRTAWQGKMFEFLQQEKRKPEVDSLNEMIAKNFTFYMHKGYMENVSDFSRR